jgi:hypothetical protein
VHSCPYNLTKPSAPNGLFRRDPWQTQVYETESFNIPVFEVNKTKNTAPGLLYLTPPGPDIVINSTLIVSEDGELVWHSEYSNFYTNF